MNKRILLTLQPKNLIFGDIMVTTAIPHTANSYWSVVKHLSADAKRDLITLLSNSLNSTTTNKVSAKKYYGIWGDDGMTDDEFPSEQKPES